MTRRADGRYQEKITINGKPKYFYGKTKADVINKMSQFQKDAKESPLFASVAEEWWDEHEPTLAAQSIRPYKAAYKRAVITFGQIRIAKIEPLDISRQIGLFAQDHADKTTRTQLMIYNLIFRYAVLHGYINTNPAREVQVPKNLPKEKRKTASSEDIQTIKESVNLPFGLFAYMAMYTGLRKGELLALTWKDIDLQHGFIVIDKSLEHIGHQPHIKPPKTETSNRLVIIPNDLMTVLKTQKNKDGIVFPAASGNYMGHTQFLRAWRRYVKDTNIKCTPHQLRHTYATLLFENGISVKEAQHLLGHAQYSTTMDTYTEFRYEHYALSREKIRKLSLT